MNHNRSIPLVLALVCTVAAGILLAKSAPDLPPETAASMIFLFLCGLMIGTASGVTEIKLGRTIDRDSQAPDTETGKAPEEPEDEVYGSAKRYADDMERWVATQTNTWR